MRHAITSIIAALSASTTALAAPQVYEGFNYAPGLTPIASMNTGNGWAGAFSGTFNGPNPTAVPIVAGSYTHPESPAPSGNALGYAAQQGQSISLTRAIAQPFTTDQTIWMSCVVNLDNLPSAGHLYLGQPQDPNSPGIEFWTAGYRIDPGAGNAILISWPNGPFLPNVYFLLRFAPAVGNQRQMDLWFNPGTNGLGAPNHSVVGDAVLTSSFSANLSVYTGIDEIRIDTNLANVYVPAPTTTAALLLPAFTTLRRRR